MIGLKNFRKNGPIRRALPALAISAVGVLAMIGAILVHHSAGLSPYFVPAATALLNLFLIYVIGLFDGDADGEVFVAGIFFLALLSLISGLAWFLVALRLEWWIYVLIAALLLGALILVYSGALRKKYRGGPHYFSTFGIILVPIQFSQPISETEAVQREKDGSVYYIGHFDDSAKLLTAEKRRNGKTDFKYTYFYERKRVVEYIIEKATFDNGKPTRYRKTPTGPWARVIS